MQFRSNYFVVIVVLLACLSVSGCRGRLTSQEREVIAWASRAEAFVIPAGPMLGSGAWPEQEQKVKTFIDNLDAWLEKGKFIPRAEDVLIRLLERRDSHIQPIVAIFALEAAVGTEKSVPVLLKYAMEDQDDLTRTEACGALGCIGAPEAVPGLREILFNDKDSGTRISAAEALAKILGKEAIEILNSRLREIDVTKVHDEEESHDLRRERRFLKHILLKLNSKDWQKPARSQSLFDDMYTTSKTEG